jgi:hypothetical protein
MVLRSGYKEGGMDVNESSTERNLSEYVCCHVLVPSEQEICALL